MIIDITNIEFLQIGSEVFLVEISYREHARLPAGLNESRQSINLNRYRLEGAY